MKKYPAYKEFTDIWLDKLPKDWLTERMKWLFIETSIKGVQGPQLVASQHNGVILKKHYEARTVEALKGTEGFKYVRQGNFVISLRSFQGGIEIAHATGIISPAYTILELKSDLLNQEYFKYLAKSAVFIKLLQMSVTGIREGQNVNYSALKQHLIPIPTLSEQQQIVRYLDWKTSQINHLIHGYERLISLLEERKKAVINEAVTKGIRKDVAMKDSGVEWLGEVPVNWEINRAKWMFSESKERRHDDDEMATASQKYGIILQKDFMEKEQRRIVMADQNTEAWKHVEPNDFVISLRSFQGGLEMSKITGCVTWHYIVLKARKDIYPEYYKWLFKSQGYIHALQRTSDFIRDGQDLRYTNFEKVPLPYLPLDEQKEIAEYITQKLNRIEFVLATTQKEIDLLRERRTRLISDVVTGALDVRDVVVPEYVQEQDMEVTEDGDEYEGERAVETNC